MFGEAYQNHVKETYACFHCRKSFKQAQEYKLCNPMRTDADGKRIALCPECQTPMRNMGKFFKAPRQADIRQWRKVETLFTHGIAYHYYDCGCSQCAARPRNIPKTLREVPAFLKEQEQAQRERKRQQENAAKAQEREKLRNKKRKIRAAKIAAKTNPT